MTSARPRVAVVGAGPSGLYAAAALVASGAAVGVDVLDRLPAPYGLVRYGVAPDHMKMKSVVRVLARPFGPGEVRFLGGVAVGNGPGQVPLEVLRAHYTAVVHASGCGIDRRLGIPGEDLPGSIGSTALVGWYCGHPDHGRLRGSTPPPSPSSVPGTSLWTSPVCWPAPRTSWSRRTFPTPSSTPCAAAPSAMCTCSSGAARSR